MNYIIQLRNQERLDNEKKNKRVSSYWWVYDDTNNLYNANNIILEVCLMKNDCIPVQQFQHFVFGRENDIGPSREKAGF